MMKYKQLTLPSSEPGLPRKIFSLALLTLLVSGCGIFGDDEKKALEPLELVSIKESLDVRRLWSTKVGGGTELLRIALSPASDGDRVFAASYDGNVVALDAESGNRIWRTETDVLLSAGPGVGDGIVVVAGYDGDLIALNSADGREIWRQDIAGESLARPIIQEKSVIVYSIDGRLRVFSSFDGREQWTLQQELPALTQRGSATPIVVGTSVIAGFDNGRLAAINLLDGTQLWEAVLTPPSGRSDLDRLADVDGALAVVGQDVYAASYNGRIAAIAAESGQVLWTREISSPAGVSADWANVYTIGNNGEVIALLRRNGNDAWQQESLLRREPTTPVPFGTSVVVGDYDGYVHFFSNVDGRPVARRRVGKGMISGTPTVVGDRLLVQSENGTVTAFRVRLPEGAPAPATAPVEPDPS